MTPIPAVSIADSLQGGFNAFFAFLPNLIGFLVILIIGYIVAKIVSGIVVKLLQKVGLDRALHSGATGSQVERLSPGASPSKLIGAVVFWLIMLFVLSAAIGALKIPAVTMFMNSVLSYLPNVIAAVVIFVIAGAIAAGVAALVARTMGDTPTGKLVATVVPVLIMAIATFMILNQLRIAPQIVTITYAVLLGSLGLGMALAFGLGGRETAGRLVSGAYDKAQQQSGQVKSDLKSGQQQASNLAADSMPDQRPPAPGARRA